MKKNRFFVGAFIYFVFLSVLSHIPASAMHALEWDIWDKAAHFFAYLPLGLLLMLGFTCRGSMGRWLAIPLMVTGIVFGLGVIDELHQFIIPGRNSAFGDVVADTSGGFVGAVVGLFVGLGVTRRNRLEDEKRPIQLPF